MPPEDSTRPRTWKQLLLKLGVSLLLLAGGAIVNVAVAWECKRELGNTHDPKWTSPTTSQLARFVPTSWSVDVTEWGAFHSTGFGISVMDAFHQVGSLPDKGVVIIRTGWPLLGCEGATWWQSSATGRELPLPLRPLWPGFAINTIFYAAILWLLWIARRTPGKIRRFIRVSRGRCPACGFIIAPGTAAASPGGGPCSECGAALVTAKSPR